MIPAAAHAQPAPVTIQQLQGELARRDALIISLLSRVKALEERNSSTAANSSTVIALVAPQQPDQRGAAETRREGALDVDELAAERALERTLVQEGVSLLRAGQLQFNASTGFSHSQRDFAASVASGSANFVGDRSVLRKALGAELGLYIGLPSDAQVEISIPYFRASQETSNSIGGVTQSASERTGSGFGSVEVALAKTLLSSEASQAKLIGRLRWVTGTGSESDNGVALSRAGSGIGAELSASMRRDPLVFFINGGYTTYAPHGAFDRQRLVDVVMGSAVALSPESALTFSLAQSRNEPLIISGIRQPGSTPWSSSFGFSASTILARGTYLRVGTNIGLTKTAPDYQLSVSISTPLRFNHR